MTRLMELLVTSAGRRLLIPKQHATTRTAGEYGASFVALVCRIGMGRISERS